MISSELYRFPQRFFHHDAMTSDNTATLINTHQNRTFVISNKVWQFVFKRSRDLVNSLSYDRHLRQVYDNACGWEDFFFLSEYGYSSANFIGRLNTMEIRGETSWYLSQQSSDIRHVKQSVTANYWWNLLCKWIRIYLRDTGWLYMLNTLCQNFSLDNNWKCMLTLSLSLNQLIKHPSLHHFCLSLLYLVLVLSSQRDRNYTSGFDFGYDQVRYDTLSSFRNPPGILLALIKQLTHEWSQRHSIQIPKYQSSFWGEAGKAKREKSEIIACAFCSQVLLVRISKLRMKWGIWRGKMWRITTATYCTGGDSKGGFLWILKSGLSEMTNWIFNFHLGKGDVSIPPPPTRLNNVRHKKHIHLFF